MTEFAALWPAMGALTAAIAALVYARRAQRLRQIPNTSIATAPHAYIELAGIARAMSKNSLNAPLSGQPCVWYRYKVEQHGLRGIRERLMLRQGESNDIFFIQDDSGRCAINPLGAQISATHTQRWQGQATPADGAAEPNRSSLSFTAGLYRYTEERIHDGDRFYAVGQFKTVHAAGQAPVDNRARAYRLSARKQQPPLRLAPIDPEAQTLIKKWLAACPSAARETTPANKKPINKPAVHTIGPNADKRQPLILSGTPQQRHIQKYTLYTGACVTVFILASLITIQIVNGNNDWKTYFIF